MSRRLPGTIPTSAVTTTRSTWSVTTHAAGGVTAADLSLARAIEAVERPAAGLTRGLRNRAARLLGMSRRGTSATSAIESPIVVASNRGPVSFDRDDRGKLTPRRGTGGLVTALSGVFYRDDTAWVSAAMTDGDRAVALKGRTVTTDSSQRMRYVVIPPERYDGYYNEVSNRILWMVHHNLWDIPRSPLFDDGTQEAWKDFVEANRMFAEALAQEADNDPVYLIQDYHLCLVPGMLRELVPEAKIVHFSHTPFAGATYLRVLPVTMRTAILRGMAGADVLGFQAKQWAESYLLSARSLPELRVLRGGRIESDGRTRPCDRFPVAVSAEPLRETANSPEADEVRAELREWAGDVEDHAARRPPGAVEEHPARVPRLRAVPATQPGVGGRRAIPLPLQPVARGRARVPELRRGMPRRRRAHQRRVRHEHVAADRDPSTGGLCVRGGGLRSVRPAVREPHLRRHEPRRDGGSTGESARRGAGALPERRRRSAGSAGSRSE